MAGTNITGNLELRIDADEVSARLEFVPSAEAEQWNADKILQLLSSKGLTPLPSPRTLEELLQKWHRQKESSQVVVVQGLAPENPEREVVRWAPLEPDEEAAQFMDETIAAAAPPEIIRVRIERIKRETVVKKASPLPFLPPKEEVVVEWDKREIKERVSVDVTVQERGWAERGERLGTIQPPKPGKPGKSVFGKPIPPVQLEDPSFLFGATILRDKSELHAAVTGVVRIGLGWADIVPLPRPCWDLRQGSDGITWLLDYEPGDGRFRSPTARFFLEAAVEKGADAITLLDEEELDRVIFGANSTGTPLTAFSISRHRNGEAKVTVSADGLVATLSMFKGVGGGTALDLKSISEAIKASGVRGFDAPAVKETILAFYKGPEIELVDYPLKEGRAPTRGKDRTFGFSVDFLKDEERSDAASRVEKSPLFPGDFIDQDAFMPSRSTGAALIRKDAELGKITPASEGSPGEDVFGRALPAIPGNDPVLRVHGGLRLTREGLFAERSGILFIMEEEGGFSAYVVPYADATVAVKVSPDAMEASVDLVRELGAGKPLSPLMVNTALAAAGITKGIEQESIGAAIAGSQEKGEISDFVVARGEPPVAGGGLGVKWLVRIPTGKGVKIGPDGRADYKNQERFIAVKQGEPIVELIRQGEDGRAGYNVLGRVIEPSKTQDSSLTHDSSIVEETIPGGVRLLAGKAGELALEGKALSIAAIHAIPGDVSNATGNVNFPGEVRVKGGVATGFAVVAGGDVYVGGTVEAALVSSGGRLVVTQGVLGRGKGALRARSTIAAAFAENATLLAVEDIQLRSSCLQCRVKTNGKLGLVGEKGHLVGGFCRARAGIEVANLGSERGIRTEVSFGQDYLLKDQIEATEAETDKIKAALLNLDKRMNAVTAEGKSIELLRKEKVRLLKMLEQRGLKLLTMRERFEAHHDSRVRVRGTVFPGVVLESHGRYYEIKQRKEKIEFFFDLEIGRIQERPITESAR